MNIKSLVKKFFLKKGYEISRSIKNGIIYDIFSIDVIFDVGANEGQYAQTLRKRGFKRKIISFEPLTKAHKKLLEISKFDQSWYVHPRSALGNIQSNSVINVANNSQSSSIKKMLPNHIEAAPDSGTVGIEKIEILTLNDVFHDYVRRGEKVYLKIDTQGYEMEVITGALGVLDKIDVVEVEISVVQLYQGSPSYLEILNFFETNGFVLWNIAPAFLHPRTNQMLQFDVIFVRDSAIPLAR